MSNFSRTSKNDTQTHKMSRLAICLNLISYLTDLIHHIQIYCKFAQISKRVINREWLKSQNLDFSRRSRTILCEILGFHRARLERVKIGQWETQLPGMESEFPISQIRIDTVLNRLVYQTRASSTDRKQEFGTNARKIIIRYLISRNLPSFAGSFFFF